MEATKSIQSITRAIDILRCFSAETPELKLAEIAELTELNKSTCHGIINTLKNEGLIDQNDDNLKYRLGLGILVFSETIINSLNILTVAAPILDRLRSQVNETMMIGKLDKTEVVYIYKKETSQSMRIVTSIGERNPAYCTSLGKAMLAHLNQEELQSRLPKTLSPKTSKTITEKTILLEQLETVRKLGYSIEQNETFDGLSCIGAPIFNNKGKVVYAVSIAAPSIRMDATRVDTISKLLMKAASEISLNLGYRPKVVRSSRT